MNTDPRLKNIAPHYTAARDTFLRLDQEVAKLIAARDNKVISYQEMCIKNILQALMVQIPAVSHDIRRLAVNGRATVDNTEREDALKLAIANIERLRKVESEHAEAAIQKLKADRAVQPKPSTTEKTTAKKTIRKKTIRKKTVIKKK